LSQAPHRPGASQSRPLLLAKNGCAQVLHLGFERGHAVFSNVGHDRRTARGNAISDVVGKLFEIVLGGKIGSVSYSHVSSGH